jgi:hypothetical protein
VHENEVGISELEWVVAVHMLDLECRESSDEALGTPESEPKPVGNVRDWINNCAAEELQFSYPTADVETITRLRPDLDDILKNMLCAESNFMVDPGYLCVHRQVTAALRLELVRWMILVRCQPCIPATFLMGLP